MTLHSEQEHHCIFEKAEAKVESAAGDHNLGTQLDLWPSQSQPFDSYTQLLVTLCFRAFLRYKNVKLKKINFAVVVKDQL